MFFCLFFCHDFFCHDDLLTRFLCCFCVVLCESKRVKNLHLPGANTYHLVQEQSWDKMNLGVTQSFLYSNYLAWFQLRQNLFDQNEYLQSQIYQNMLKISEAETEQSNVVALANFRAILVAQNQALYTQINANYCKIEELTAYLQNNYNLYSMNMEKMNAAKHGSSFHCNVDNCRSDNGSFDNDSFDNGSSDNGSFDNGSFDNGNSSNDSSSNCSFANHEQINFTHEVAHEKRSALLKATKKRYLYQFKNASQTNAQWRLIKQQGRNSYVCALHHKAMHAFEQAMHNQRQLQIKTKDFQAWHEHKHIRASKLFCFHAMQCSMKFRKSLQCKLSNFRNQIRCKHLTKCFAQFGIEKEKCMRERIVAQNFAVKIRLAKWCDKWRHETIENITHEKFFLQWHKQQSNSKHLKKTFSCFKKYRITASINAVLVKLCKSRIKLETLKFKCFFILLIYVQGYSATKLHIRLHESILCWSKLCRKYLYLNTHMQRRKIVMLYFCFNHLKQLLFKKYVQTWTLGAWNHFARKALSKYNMLLICVKTQIANNVLENGMLNNLRQICPLCGICGFNSATNKIQFENFKWQFTSFADLRNEQLVDDLLYLHEQVRYKDHDITFASNKLSNEKKTEMLREFESYPHKTDVNFLVGVHWCSCFHCDGIFSMTVRASVFNIPRQLSGINYLLTKRWQQRNYEIQERVHEQSDLIVALSAHICDVGMKPHTPNYVMKNLQTKRKQMRTTLPHLQDQVSHRFPSLSCILAKLNEDDIGLHYEYLKYKTTFFRLGFNR